MLSDTQGPTGHALEVPREEPEQVEGDGGLQALRGFLWGQSVAERHLPHLLSPHPPSAPSPRSGLSPASPSWRPPGVGAASGAGGLGAWCPPWAEEVWQEAVGRGGRPCVRQGLGPREGKEGAEPCPHPGYSPQLFQRLTQARIWVWMWCSMRRGWSRTSPKAESSLAAVASRTFRVRANSASKATGHSHH